MVPHLFSIGDYTITSFGLMLFLAFVVGAWAFGKQLGKRGVDPDTAWDMLLWIALGGIAGAKLYYLGLHFEAFVAAPLRELSARGGLVWYGGFLGGAAAFYWQVRRRGLGLASTFDAASPALALAYAVGRVGCFLVGDDYGRPTDAWVGIAFPEGYPPSTAGYFRSIGTHIPAQIPDAAVLAVHPTQLYEVGLALITFAILWRLSGRVRAGRLFAAYLAMYGMERFMIEVLRAKTDHVLAGLTTSQLVSLALLAAAGVLWRRTTSSPRPGVEGAPAVAGRGPVVAAAGVADATLAGRYEGGGGSDPVKGGGHP